jgi:hypothetical protein
MESNLSLRTHFWMQHEAFWDVHISMEHTYGPILNLLLKICNVLPKPPTWRQLDAHDDFINFSLSTALPPVIRLNNLCFEL